MFEKGYYDDAPDLLSDTLLYNCIGEKRIADIVKRFIGYEGPEGYRITKENLEMFLKQFLCACEDKSKCSSLLKGICAMLEHALIIDREYIGHKAAPKFNELARGDSKLYMVPLGSLRDSAKHMTYFWNDVQCSDLTIETESSLEELLQMEEVDRITFFDDGSYSGTQVISIMQEYMGVTERKTQEEHVKELPEACQEALCKKDIQFFFCAFNKNNEEDIRTELKKIGLKKVVFDYIEDMSVQCLESGKNGWFENDEQRKLTKKVLHEIGLSVMQSSKMWGDSYKEGWSQERIERAALGYNDAQQMVFLKSSVPTYTITAFWAEGTYKDIVWKPLFRRTRK